MLNIFKYFYQILIIRFNINHLFTHIIIFYVFLPHTKSFQTDLLGPIDRTLLGAKTPGPNFSELQDWSLTTECRLMSYHGHPFFFWLVVLFFLRGCSWWILSNNRTK